MHFYDRKILYFNAYFTEVCSYRSNRQQSSIGSDNGLVLNRRQAIIWTNADLIHWCIFVWLEEDKLTLVVLNLFQETLDMDGLVQDCSNSSALAMELQQFCTKTSIYISMISDHWDGKGSWNRSFDWEDKGPFVLNIQYHGWWWPGDARREGISRHWHSSSGLSRFQHHEVSKMSMVYWWLCTQRL